MQWQLPRDGGDPMTNQSSVSRAGKESMIDQSPNFRVENHPMPCQQTVTLTGEKALLVQHPHFFTKF